MADNGVIDVPGVEDGKNVGRGEAREAERPLFVLENHEDRVYHDQSVGDLAAEPEYCAFLGKSWVFNRRMRWLRPENGTVLCLTEGGDLPLTGEQAASEWSTDPANDLVNEGSTLRFRTPPGGRRRDAVVLPGFQFSVQRHPVAELVVTECVGPWQFAVLIKGRSGPPLWSGGWRSGAATLSVDLRAELHRRGYMLHHHELFFAVGTWREQAGDEAAVCFELRLKAVPAVAPCLPVIRTEASAGEGVPLSAVVLAGNGDRVKAGDGSVTAAVGGREYALRERDGVWTGRIPGLPVGDCEVELVARGRVEARSFLHVRVTSGSFFAYDADPRSLVKDGEATGPLTGSYQGLAVFRDVGGDTERMVNGQDAFDAWDRSVPPGEHWHYWEALTPAELGERFAYLAQCGWRVLHLCQHWGTWEKLDAGGRIAPHGAEQAALYYRTAERHGLSVCQALSHYPYGPSEQNRTPPVRTYLDAGYTPDQWTDAASPFTAMFHRYLSDYVTLFRDETALLCLTTSGEGDIAAGPDRVNDTWRFVTSLDPNHLFVSEPIHRMRKLPREHSAGWDQPLFGSRLYWIGEAIEPELDLGVEYKFMQTGPVCAAEGSWPCPHLYAESTGKPFTWAGSRIYRTRLRDSLYIGLVHRSPMILTWDEQQAEDEHAVSEEVRSLIDWQQPWLPAPVAIRVDNPCVLDEGRARLAGYERFLAELPAAGVYVLPDEDAPPGTACVVDMRASPGTPALVSRGGAIPDAVAETGPLRVAEGYRTWYLWSADRRTLVAYVVNSTRHVEQDVPLGGTVHRLPGPCACEVALRNLPDALLQCRVYDLDRKALIRQTTVCRGHSLPLGVSASDMLVVVTPS